MIDEDMRIQRAQLSTGSASEAKVPSDAVQSNGLDSVSLWTDDGKYTALTEDQRGVGTLYQMHKDVEVRGSSKEGRGLYATALIKRGTIVWQEAQQMDEVSHQVDSLQWVTAHCYMCAVATCVYVRCM